MAEEPAGVNYRKLKVYAYRKARRLIRIGERKVGHPKRELFEGVVAMILGKDGKEQVDEETVRSERLERNQEWRRRKEAERWQSSGRQPPPGPDTIKENNRKIARKIEKKVYRQFLCSNCRQELLGEVWECLDGHLTCGDCFDRDNIGTNISGDEEEEDLERSDVITTLRKLSRTSRRPRGRGLKKGRSVSDSSVATVTSIDTIISLRESLADIAEGDEEALEEETKSFQRYLVNTIDFFLNTLEVRKDAIDFYKDYNNADKSIFYNPDLEGLSLDGDAGNASELQNDAYVDEKSERARKYISRLNDQGSLTSLRETLVDVMEVAEADIDPSWAKFRLEEIDFYLNTLNIRKDAIGYYGDYHNGDRPIFDYFCSEDTGTVNSEVGDREDMDAVDTLANVKTKVTRCKVCRKYILRRNILVEKLAKTFLVGK